MYSGVFTNVPAFEQPATVSWLRYLLIVKGCGGGEAPRAGCCAPTPMTPTAAAATSAADARTRFDSFTEILLSHKIDLRDGIRCLLADEVRQFLRLVQHERIIQQRERLGWHRRDVASARRDIHVGVVEGVEHRVRQRAPA